MSTSTISSPFINGRPPEWASGYGQDRYGYFADFSIPTGPHYWQFVAQRMRWIPAGTFVMGSPEDEEGRLADETQHEVTLTQGFWLADTACSQSLWQAIMGTNPSEFAQSQNDEGDLPVETVSFDDVQEFIKTLNDRVGATTFALPTEAQWEYACRAGTDTPFSFGNTISTVQANFDGNHPYGTSPKGDDRRKTVSVKSLPCNAWGLYEMHGNVWEWCEDRYADYVMAESIDPRGPKSGSFRVIRGGSWYVEARGVRSARRYGDDPSSSNFILGFRLLSLTGHG